MLEIATASRIDDRGPLDSRSKSRAELLKERADASGIKVKRLANGRIEFTAPPTAKPARGVVKKAAAPRASTATRSLAKDAALAKAKLATALAARAA